MDNINDSIEFTKKKKKVTLNTSIDSPNSNYTPSSKEIIDGLAKDLDFGNGVDFKSLNLENEVSAKPSEVKLDDVVPEEDIFNVTRKKKKKKVLIALDEDELDMENKIEDGETMNDEPNVKGWLSSNRDYRYQELLSRVFDIMKDKNPELAAGEKKKLIMRPPQVARVGTKKTSFVNFIEICNILHRHPQHLVAYLLAELGTSGSIDGNNQFIIKGKFQQKQIENLLRRYIKEYVTCHTCRSPNTLLQKDTRLFFLQCEVCGSRCSVVSIKSGFQAVTAKRAAIRAKTT